MVLGSVVGSRDNNFNLIRFIAAFSVIAFHSWAMVFGEHFFDGWLAAIGEHPGRLAVDVFFITSGFLVTHSLVARGDGLAFTVARVLRIYPGLIVCLAFCALVLGPLLSTLPARDYAADPVALAAYVWQNVQPFTLPMPYGALPGANILNGSLWSIPVEACCYVVLVSGWVIVRRARSMTAGNVAVLAFAAICLALAAHRFFLTAGFSLLWMFAVGGLLHACRDRIVLNKWAALGALAILLATIGHRAAFQAVLMVALPYIVMCAAYLPSGVVRHFNKIGDLSYGMYVYGYPMQLAVTVAVPGIGPVALMLLGGSASAALAGASWKLVEKPALRGKDQVAARLRRLWGSSAGVTAV